MNTTTKVSLAAVFLTLGTLTSPNLAWSETHSKSTTVVVNQNNLPATAREASEAMFLHSDNAGSTYLYLEQRNGSRLAILDVSDPAHITLAATVSVAASGRYDVERELGFDAELVRFRGEQEAAVLDLRKAKHPVLQPTPILNPPSQAEPLGDTALLLHHGTQASLSSPRVFQVVDTTVPTKPQLLATIHGVTQRLTFGETGTTFLLSDSGLTVIRRTDVEAEHQMHEMQLRGN